VGCFKCVVLAVLGSVVLGPVAPASADQLFAPNSYVNRPLPDSAPIDPNSAAKIADLYRQIQTTGTLPKATVSMDGYTSTLYSVPSGQATVPVLPASPYNPLDPNNLANQWASVPLPSSAVASSGTDANLTVYQPTTDTLWEFAQMAQSNGQWHAVHGGRLPGISTNPGYFTAPPLGPGQSYGATATGIPLLAGLQRISELEAGSINHVVSFSIPRPAYGPVWPAQRQDNWLSPANQDPLAIHEGAILRLPPTMNIDALGMPPYATMLAKAIQRYGMVLRDSGAHFTFYAEDVEPILKQTGCNPYAQSCAPGQTAIFAGGEPNELGQLKNFPWLSLKVVAVPVGGFGPVASGVLREVGCAVQAVASRLPELPRASPC
jgi:hypothetical protein